MDIDATTRLRKIHGELAKDVRLSAESEIFSRYEKHYWSSPTINMSTI